MGLTEIYLYALLFAAAIAALVLSILSLTKKCNDTFDNEESNNRGSRLRNRILDRIQRTDHNNQVPGTHPTPVRSPSPYIPVPHPVNPIPGNYVPCAKRGPLGDYDSDTCTEQCHACDNGFCKPVTGLLGSHKLEIGASCENCVNNACGDDATCTGGTCVPHEQN